MTSAIIVVVSMVAFAIAYVFYGRFLAHRLFQVDDREPCPSQAQEDGVDFVPTKRVVLFGHHFTSIAGTGPIVGPAIAIIWGWVPALLWVLFGSILIGAVHDLGAMVISVKNRGRSIGDLAGEIVSPRVRFLFLLIIFFALWLVVAVFGVVIASVFDMFPSSVAPCWLQLPIAVGLGYIIYKKNGSYLIFGLLAAVLMYLTIAGGQSMSFSMPAVGKISPMGVWVVVLLIYAYVASTLPVQVLLQPRDYINAIQLLIAMVLLFLGILVSRPEMAAPAINTSPTGAPPVLPMLFITVACGAVSGFHSLVSSGTSSKQCDLQSSCLPIAYGGMLFEGLLAVFVLIACGAGLGMGMAGPDGSMLTGVQAFNTHYSSWGAAGGLAANLAAFITGGSNMVATLGLPAGMMETLMGVFVASFAATTLDTATRIQRYIVSELAVACHVPALGKKHPATAIAVLTALGLAFWNGVDGKGALTLWPVFATLNQLLAGLALLVITVYLARRARPVVLTMIPMIFMLAVTGWSMVITIRGFISDEKWLLFGIMVITVILEIWMIAEAIFEMRKIYGRQQVT